MNNLEYIDAYFRGEFSPEEVGRFEQRIQEDPAFSAEVAYYINIRAALKEASAEERITRFRAIYQGRQLPADPSRSIKLRRIGLAAAIILAALALCYLLFLKSPSSQQVASQWINKNLTHLSVKMGGTDSMQKGLDFYNKGDFSDAQRLFDAVLTSDTLNTTALLDAGIVSLRMENYDKALDLFRKLGSHTDPNFSPALFYEALTLMKRDRDGDIKTAKQLLVRIVQEDLDKKKDAQELLAQL